MEIETAIGTAVILTALLGLDQEELPRKSRQDDGGPRGAERLHKKVKLMTVMVAELYQALRESGVSENLATKAAQSVVSEERFDERLDELVTRADLLALKTELAEFKADLTRTVLIAMVAMTGVFAAIVKIL